MKVRLTLGICLMISCATSFLAYCGDLPITGEWLSKGRSKGGLGTTIIFTNDGKVTTTMGALVDFTYKIEGDKLFLSGTNGEKLSYQFKQEKNTLELKDLSCGEIQKMTKVESCSPSSIIGKWAYKHYSGAPAEMEFTKNGNCYLSVPMDKVDGKYTISDGILVIKLAGKPESKWTYSIDKDTLTITELGTDEKKIYNRKI